MCSQQVVYVKKLMEDYLRSKGWIKHVSGTKRINADNSVTSSITETWIPPDATRETCSLPMADACTEQLERDNKEKQLGTIHRF